MGRRRAAFYMPPQGLRQARRGGKPRPTKTPVSSAGVAGGWSWTFSGASPMESCRKRQEGFHTEAAGGGGRSSAGWRASARLRTGFPAETEAFCPRSRRARGREEACLKHVARPDLEDRRRDWAKGPVSAKTLQPVAPDACQHLLHLVVDLLHLEAPLLSAGPADPDDAASPPDQSKLSSALTHHARDSSFPAPRRPARHWSCPRARSGRGAACPAGPPGRRRRRSRSSPGPRP